MHQLFRSTRTRHMIWSIRWETVDVAVPDAVTPISIHERYDDERPGRKVRTVVFNGSGRSPWWKDDHHALVLCLANQVIFRHDVRSRHTFGNLKFSQLRTSNILSIHCTFPQAILTRIYTVVFLEW